MGDFYVSSQEKAISGDAITSAVPKALFGTKTGSAEIQKLHPSGARKANGKRDKENRNPSQTIKLRFEPSRFYVAKPKNRNVTKAKEEIHPPYKIRDDSTTLAKPDPQKADTTGLKPCYVRLERLTDLENSTRKLRQSDRL